jgi:DNA-binding HxlR family transcriptional regulator
MPDGTGPASGGNRSGSSVLELLANGLHARILDAHAAGPWRLSELQEVLGFYAQSTLRSALGKLEAAGALRRLESSLSPHAAVYALTSAGEEMRFAAAVLEAWLARAPRGPIEPGKPSAQAAVKAVTGSWSLLMGKLASRPFTLAELEEAIPAASRAALERRLQKMERSGQIEALERRGRGTPYEVTEWLRRSIAPLCVAGRYERRYLAATTPAITKVEVEAAFQLSIPLVELPRGVEGDCALVVRTAVGDADPRQGLAGVTVRTRAGELASCRAEIERDPATWALGSPEEWLDAVIDGDPGSLRSIGGADQRLAYELVRGTHLALFGED